MSPQPLHLILVASGVGPRREALSFVQSGRVRLNGEKVVDTLVTADLKGGDIVTLDDRSVLPERLRYVLIHKPRGVLCAMSDNNEWRGEDNDYPKFERRTLVSSLVPANITERLGHAGRLDLDSEGLVILTNDRKMMRLVTRPGGGAGASCRKKYNVTVKGTPSEVDLNFLRNGPTVGGMGQLLPCKIEMLEHIAAPIDENNNNNVRGFTRLCVELKEGKNNQSTYCDNGK